MNKFLSNDHVIFTSENPLREDQFGENRPDIFKIIDFLKENGESAELINGKFNNKIERFVLVHNPKNSAGLLQLASDLGQEKLILSRDNHNDLYFLHGDKKGTVLSGNGIKFLRHRPEDNYFEIETNEGPIYFNYSFSNDEENMGKSENSDVEKLTPSPLKRVMNALDKKRRSIIYIPDHLVIKQSSVHWRRS